MSSTRGWVAVAAVVLFGSPTPAADGDKITAAIRKGADYLKKNWAAKGAQDLTGQLPAETAVMGWALLEAGEKPDDPALQTIAKAVRENALTARNTYLVATSIVFLDKLGDPRDVPLVQVLGVRLYAGLNVAGGWTYAACDEIPAAEGQRLAGVLYQGVPPKPPKVHAEAARQFAAVRTAIATRGRRGVGDDNSNTQFGLIGLWVASRNGLPVDDAFPLIETRFFRTQNRSDAGWGYTLNAGEKSTTAMTCAGLLGLTAGAAKRAAPKPADPKTDPADDAFFNPKKPDGGDKPAVPNGTREGAIKAALQSLGGVLNSTKPGALENIVSHGNLYYVLWSIERVGVALGLDTIGDVDWYTWGADTLLPAQTADGSWKQERYSAQVNTSLALLFLCKANVFRDVSGKVKVKDPGIKELRGGSNPVFVAPKQDPPPPPTVRPGTEPVVTVPGGGLTLPPVADHPDADKLATALVSAGDADWATVLAGERDAKGVQHTAAIVRAIGKVDGARKKEARDALAERLTRMTAATLRRLLADPDPEVRRAASLACAMKDEKAHVPDLIDRITDPSDAVVRAARAGLKSLTGKDYGPDPGASDEKKVEAASDWRAWFESQPAGK